MLGESCADWDSLGKSAILMEGHALNEAQLLFDKIEDVTVEAQVNKLQAAKTANQSAQKPACEPQKPACTYDDFMKMDIRSATVLEAERVPKTDKLLKLTIDTGIDKRTIVSGIAEYYTPEQMLGQQICILANLEPRKIKGIESQGMILMAKEPNGKMRFIRPDETLANGAVIN
jgi:methionyl-tRNA synthetase